ncbi:MAG: phosphate ABC transporter permease subunit PstC [Arenicellales bacterium]
MPARPNALPDKLFGAGTKVSAFIVFSAVAGVLVALTIGAWPALRTFGWGFLTTTDWNPVTNKFGGLVAIFGTLVSSAIAMIIAIPLSFGIAVFITELAPRWLKRPIGTAIELLAAIPSIIYGMWGLFVFAPLFADCCQPWVSDHFADWPILGPLFDGPPMGIGMFTAGLILAIMVLPFITAVMRDVFEIVPPVLKESAYALGATTSEVAVKVVLPYTRVGVIGGIMLGLGRALGETMAVTFVIGNAHQLSASLFMPGTTISATLANEFTEATGEIYTSSLLALGLVLFLITFVVLALAQLLIHRTRAKVAVKA